MEKIKKKPIYFGKPIAILIDAAFFLVRYKKCYKGGVNDDAKTVAQNMYTMALGHVENEELYRILVYDCPPLEKKANNPISGNAIDYSISPIAKFRNQFHVELIRKRKVALRLGVLKAINEWRIRPRQLRELFSAKIQFSDLREDDVFYDITQKGVDMKMGLDIASLAYKKLVSRIILVTGDSDFVPAAKLARREGIDVILDPMWQAVSPSLYEHVDGMHSTCNRP